MAAKYGMSSNGRSGLGYRPVWGFFVTPMRPVTMRCLRGSFWRPRTLRWFRRPRTRHVCRRVNFFLFSRIKRKSFRGDRQRPKNRNRRTEGRDSRRLPAMLPVVEGQSPAVCRFRRELLWSESRCNIRILGTSVFIKWVSLLLLQTLLHVTDNHGLCVLWTLIVMMQVT